jgi:hypothetical protein
VTTTTPGSTSTPTTASVLGTVINSPAPAAELPRTGLPIAELAGLALVGSGLGLAALTLVGSTRRREAAAAERDTR